ncbi:MAG TPA: PQQ-dependent sugar dehydrogenase [Rhodanobacteraceae bacterium]|jgi:glucose/arabinose dehydrogenase|nr:PQQ-dependent sugar dehydrogenase [Rhodanobacteraceae bacterium]
MWAIRFLSYGLSCGLIAASAASAVAQTVPPDLALEVITDQVEAPIGVRAPHDGSGRLFVISQAGTIRVIKSGALLATPFLTVPVTYPGTGGTSGLLGLAFHPNYGQVGLPHNDEFYIVYMRAGNCNDPGSCLGSGPDEVMERYTVSSNPDVANPTGTLVLRLADNSPPSFHNGGDIHFGPDGYLYMSSGDGGQESGTHWLAECLWKKPNDTTSTSCGTSTTEPQYFLRGKMLRIDVDNRGAIATPDMCGTATGVIAEYSIPADNPFVGTTDTCDEIYLHGFRNPWRWSFDRATGDMWIGDVGQDHFEEINFRANGSADPIYYGWHCMEGTAVFNTAQVCAPPLPPNVLPLMEYDHSTGSRCAVTGGYRYRGPIKSLDGMYIFADSCSSEIFFAKPDDANAWSFTVWRNDANGYGTYSGFGEDEAGNLYIANNATNTVYRFHSDLTGLLHVVMPVAGTHGSLTPSTPQTVNDGDTIAFEVAADSGYAIESVSGCGGTLTGTTFTTAPVTADCEVDATFAVDAADVVFRDGFDPAGR